MACDVLPRDHPSKMMPGLWLTPKWLFVSGPTTRGNCQRGVSRSEQQVKIAANLPGLELGN